MSKKQKKQMAENVEVVEPDTALVGKPEDKSKVKDKSSKKDNKKKDKVEKKSLKKRAKETFSELKKVSWPSFGKVCKSTGVVIAVVAVCTLLLFGIDTLFSLIYTLLIG